MSIEGFIFLIVFVISVLVSGVAYWLVQQHKNFGKDTQGGPQKVHRGNVARTGGVAIFIAVFLASFFSHSPLLLLLIFVGTPVFVAGFIEDVTNSVGAKTRLLTSLATGCLFCWVTGYTITNVDARAIGYFLAIPVVSFLVTSLAVAAMTNAVNIVDGLNGLAGGASILMISSLGALSIQHGDDELFVICCILGSSSLGFLVWNFPFGKVFMGDGGAYFLGALIAGIAVLLPERNHEISPFSSLLIILYPFYELVRTSVRRFVANGVQMLEADDQHLHSLIYKIISSHVPIAKPLQNSLASLLVLPLPLGCCAWAFQFFDNRTFLIVGIFSFLLLYEVLLARVISMVKHQ